MAHCEASTTMDRRMGLVEMSRMFTWFSASAVNARAATPGLDFMPVPTSETFAMFLSTTYSRAPICGSTRSTVSHARSRSDSGHVNVRSVWPSSETFWMIMSTLTMLPASAENTVDAMPNWSFRSRMVTLTSEVSWATPEMTACSMDGVTSLMNVPGVSVNAEREWMTTLYFLANSTARACRTPAPAEDSSSMSS